MSIKKIVTMSLLHAVASHSAIAGEAGDAATTSISHFTITVLLLLVVISTSLLVRSKMRVKELVEREIKLKSAIDTSDEICAQSVDLQERMKVFYDQSIFGFMIIKDNKMEYVSKMALDIFEYSEDEVAGWAADDFYKIVYQDDRDDVKSFFTGTPGRKRISENYSFRLISKNRTLKWVDQCSKVIPYQGGEAVLVIFVDMTELKQVEEQVSIFKRFAESSGQGLVNMDPMGNPVFVNDVFCSTILAASAKDVLVKNITSFYPPKLKKKLLEQIIPAALKTGQWVGELPLLTTTGKMVRTLQTFFKVSDQYGKPAHVAVVVSDLSDIKLAEDELMFTKNYIRNVFHSLQSMLVSINSDFTITQWNDAAVTFSGVKADDAISGNIFEKIPFLTKYKSEIDHVIKSREKVELYRQHIPLGGQQMVFLNISCYPLSDDYMDGVVIRVDDITEMEKKDEQVRQIQKMETVSQLAGGMAHDFNNVLGGIKNSITLVKHLLTQKKLDIPHIEESIDMADDSVNKASDMIGEVLEVSQKSTLVTQPVDLNSTVKHVGIICSKTFDKSIKFKLSSYDDPAMVDADPAKLENALLNVCRNAQNAMVAMRDNKAEIGGELAIGIEIIYADKHFCSVHPEATEGYYWILRVTDTGVGLDTKIISKIFDPFFSTKKTGKGAGLGLAMVYNIIQQHKGFIDIYSEVGVGSTFNIFIPELCEGKAVELEAFEDGDVELKGEGCVMVVDDEPIIRLTAKSILEECGYEVITADNGRQALELFKKKHAEVDIILLDMAMPVLSGKDAFVEIRKIHPTQKILMASGFKQDERLKEVMDMGANGFIQKPYSLDDLAKKVKSILSE